MRFPPKGPQALGTHSPTRLSRSSRALCRYSTRIADVFPLYEFSTLMLLEAWNPLSYESRAPAMANTVFWTASIPHVSMLFTCRLLNRSADLGHSSPDLALLPIALPCWVRTIVSSTSY